MGQHASHLPRRHLAVVGVAGVVALNACQVCVVGEEGWGGQTLPCPAPHAGWDGKVAKLVKYCMALSVCWIVGAKEGAGVGVVELHADAARGVAVARRVPQLNALVLAGVAPAAGVLPNVAILHHILPNSQHNFISDTICALCY